MPSEDTQFKPGQSGNPSGRPKGSVSLTTLIIEELSKGDQAEARKMVRAAIRAAKKGDMKAFAQIIERTDGKVAQRIDIEQRVRDLAVEAGVDPDEVVEEARGYARGQP